MMEFYVRDTQLEAQADADLIFSRLKARMQALGYAIHADGSIIGKNAFSGRNAPGKQRMVAWSVPEQRGDGKWVVRTPASKHPELKRDDIAAPIEVWREEWWQAEPPTLKAP